MNFRKLQRRVPLCIFLIYRCPKELVMLFQTLCIARRLQDELKQFQKRWRMSRLLAHGIQERSLPVVTIPGRSSSPSLNSTEASFVSPKNAPGSTLRALTRSCR